MAKDRFSGYLQMAAVIALGHHEKYDGTGYPTGLKGDHIPLEARIVAIADVYDALTSVRPYKSAWPVKDALIYMEKQAGQHFDPRLLEFLARNRLQVVSLCARFSHHPGQWARDAVPWRRCRSRPPFRSASPPRPRPP